MNVLLRAALVSAVSACVVVSAPAQQPTPNPDVERIYTEKPKFSFDFKSGAKGGPAKTRFDRIEMVRDQYMILEGNAAIEYQDVEITAHRITYNLKTNDVEAVGNVIVDRGPDRLSADRVIMNLDTKTGTFFNARASLQPSIYFSGEIVEKIDDDTFRITNGLFTSCDIDEPDWSFRLKSGVVRMEDYARLKNLSFRASKLPLFWTPYIVWPTKENRAHGLLLPKFGNSEIYGALLGLRYFVPYKEWADATIIADLYSEGYYGLGTDVRYTPDEGTAGRLQMYAVKDPLFEENGTDEYKWKYAYRHTQDDLPGGFRGVIDIRDFSDIDFFRQFEREFELNTISNVYSAAYLTKNATGYSVNLRADRREIVSGSTSSQVYEQLPSLEYKVYPNRIASSPLYFALESSLSNLRNNGNDYQRADAFPTLSLQLRTPAWFAIKPSIGGRYTYYTSSLDPSSGQIVEEELTRTYGQALVEFIGPSFSRVFDRKIGTFAKFKHVIEPRFRYLYTTDVEDQEFVPRFDTVDSPSLPLVRESVEYALVQRVIAKESGENASAREILQFTVKQAVSLTDSPFDPNSPTPSKYTPWSISLRAAPHNNINFDATASLDDQTHRISQASVSANLRGQDRYLNLRWFATWAIPGELGSDSSQIQLRAGSPIIPGRLRADVQFSFDSERSSFLEQRYILGYFGDCWGTRVEYRELAVPSPTRDYVVSVSLRNIGELFDFRGSIDSLPF
jgi:LPS-assembly protein